MASVAVVTVPSVPTAMGRTVGTVTDIAVAAESPFREPSAVEDRVTLEVADPPSEVTSAAEANAVMAKHIARTRHRDRIRVKFFFIVEYTPF